MGVLFYKGGSMPLCFLSNLFSSESIRIWEIFYTKSFLYLLLTSKSSKCASCVVLGEIIPFSGRKRADFSCTPVPSEQGQGPRRYYCIIVATPCRPFYSCDKTVLSDFYWLIQILCHDYYQVLMW